MYPLVHGLVRARRLRQAMPLAMAAAAILPAPHLALGQPLRVSPMELVGGAICHGPALTMGVPQALDAELCLSVAQCHAFVWSQAEAHALAPTPHSSGATLPPVQVDLAEAVLLAPGAISGAGAIHAPTLADVPILVCPMVLVGGAICHGPALTMGVPKILDAESSPSVGQCHVLVLSKAEAHALAPTPHSSGATLQPVQVGLAGAVALTPGAISGAGAIHAPTVAGAPLLAYPTVLAGGLICHGPALTTGVPKILDAESCQSVGQCHGLVLSKAEAHALAPTPHSSGSTLQPVQVGLAGAVALTPGAISAANAIHAPTLACQNALGINLAESGSGAVIYGPTVAALVRAVEVSLLGSAATFPAAQVGLAGAVPLLPEAISTAGDVHAPTVTLASPLSAQPGFAAAAPAFYQPTITSGATGFRYFRLSITYGYLNRACRMLTIRWQGDPGGDFPPNMTSDSAPSPWSTIGTAAYSTFFRWKAFDSNEVTYFRTTTSPTVSSPTRIGVDAGSGASLRPTAVAITANASYLPVDFTVECSADGSTWTQLAAVVGNTSASLTVPLTYP